MFNILKASGRTTSAAIFGLGLAVSMVFAGGVERAQASTVACSTAVAATLTTNLGCEVSTSASQDNTNPPLVVNTENFFGPADWTFLGKNDIDDGTSGANPPTLTGTDVAQSGTLGIVASLWTTYGQVMAIFKDGSDTFLTGFLLNTGDTSFTYSSPFLVAGGNPKDVSHVSLYGRGTGGGVTPPSPVPLPAGLPLILTALGGLVAVGRRKSRKAA